MREIRVDEIWATQADARAGEVEARRARSAARGGAARGRPGEGTDRARAVQARVHPHGALDPGRRRHRDRDGRRASSSTAATGSSITRPSTVCAPTSDAWPRSAIAESTCSSGTRRTRSARASPARSAWSVRRSGRSSRCAAAGSSSRASRRTSTGCSRRSTSASTPGARWSSSGRSMRRNMNVARNLGYVEVPEDVLVKPADLDGVPPGEQLIICTGLAGRAALGADPDRLQRPSRR